MTSITSTNLAAQIFGFIAILLFRFVYTTHKRKVLITLKFVTDFLWGLHYFWLGAYTGALMNAVKNCEFYQISKSFPFFFPLFISSNSR